MDRLYPSSLSSDRTEPEESAKEPVSQARREEEENKDSKEEEEEEEEGEEKENAEETLGELLGIVEDGQKKEIGHATRRKNAQHEAEEEEAEEEEEEERHHKVAEAKEEKENEEEEPEGDDGIEINAGSAKAIERELTAGKEVEIK